MDGTPVIAVRADTGTISAVLRGVDQASVTVFGALDAPAVERLEAMLHGVVAAGARYVVLDLSDVIECDGRAREVLSATQDQLTAMNGWLLPLTPPSQLADLDNASLDDLFAAYRQATMLVA